MDTKNPLLCGHVAFVDVPTIISSVLRNLGQKFIAMYASVVFNGTYDGARATLQEEPRE